MRRVLTAKAHPAVIALMAVGVVLVCSAWFINKYTCFRAETIKERLWPTPTAEQVAVQKLHSIAGWFSLDCGHVRSPNPVEVDRAIACAQKALGAKRRFYITFDFVGMDSHGATGLAAGWRGIVYEVTTDQLDADIYGVPKADVNPCEAAPVEKITGINRYLMCWTAEDDRALGR